LVREVHRDWVLQIDVPLAPAVERANALSGIALLGLRDGKKGLGVFVWILHAHAAMTVRPYRFAK
jgi:hypothetical protein